MERILIATDGSPGARAAAGLGAEVAGWSGAEVVLMHAASLPAAMAIGVAGLPEVPGDYLETTTRYAFEQAAAVLDAAGVVHEDVVVDGDPADAIVREAERRGTDLVVMGHRGLGGLGRLLLGSVSERVLRRAKCSVLVAGVESEDGGD